MKTTKDREIVLTTISQLMNDAERDGAIDVGLWVMNNIKLSEKDYDRLNDYLDKEYDFDVYE